MLKAVIDTNVIISAALSGNSNPSKLINLALDKAIYLFYADEIMAEYADVLSRPRFRLSLEKQKFFIDGIKQVGISISPPKSVLSLPDESDRIFYDTAKESGAYLITGNAKHYPAEKFIVTPTEFLRIYEEAKTF